MERKRGSIEVARRDGDGEPAGTARNGQPAALRILTNMPNPQSREWTEKTELLDLRDTPYLRRLFPEKLCPLLKRVDMYLNHACFAVRAYRRRKTYDCFVLNMSNAAMLFALMQRLFTGPRVPLITLGSYLGREENPILYAAKRYFLHLVDVIVFFTTQEIANYCKYWGLERSKFRFLAFGHTLGGYSFAVEEGDYIFCGGNGARDYGVLFDAVGGLDCRVIVAMRDRTILHDKAVPGNVEIVSVSPQEYRNLMAKSRITVIPVLPGLLMGAGVQSYLNAMFMGKPVIVSDVPGARDYIENGLTGIIVKPGDAVELREAIRFLLAHRLEKERMGTEARKAVEERYAPEKYVRGLLDIIRDSVEEYRRKRGKARGAD